MVAGRFVVWPGVAPRRRKPVPPATVATLLTRRVARTRAKRWSVAVVKAMGAVCAAEAVTAMVMKVSIPGRLLEQ